MSRSTLAFLAADPRDRHTPLRQLEEVTRLRQALDASLLKRRVDIAQYLTARYDDLLRILRDKPDVIYFTGFHASTRGGIVLEDTNGNSAPLLTDDLVQAFEDMKSRLRLVFLSACYTDFSAEALREHADCIVGFNGLVADDFANGFPEAFFRELFACGTVQQAFDTAKRAAAADPALAENQ